MSEEAKDSVELAIGDTFTDQLHICEDATSSDTKTSVTQYADYNSSLMQKLSNKQKVAVANLTANVHTGANPGAYNASIQRPCIL